MNLEEVYKTMKAKPHMLGMGKGLLSQRLHTTPEIIVEAKRAIRNNILIKVPNKFPKVLIFDVETAPMRAYIWKLWKENIAWDHVISNWFMLCWSAKWLYSNEIISDVVTSEEAVMEDDSRIVKNLWKLIDEADIVIAYNGKKADIPWMNTRFIINGLTPPSSYMVIDPCEVAKKEFGFSSNKLDALAGYFNIEHKLETDFSLWERSINGDIEALHYMVEYNKVDVKILEEVYLRLRPWIKNHPNMSNFCLEDVCTHCASNNIEVLKGKYYYTTIGKYLLYKCKDCGTIFRSRTNLNTKKTPYTTCFH